MTQTITETTSVQDAASPKRRRGVNLGMARFSGLYLWAILVLVFGLWVPDLFLSKITLVTVASSQSIIAMLAISALISMSVGAFDVSIGALANLTTVSVICLQTIYGWGMWPAIAASLLIGAVVGFINGLFIVKFHVSPIVTTLGMGSILLALQTIISQTTQPVPPINATWTSLTQYKIFDFEIVVLYLLVLAVLVWWVLERTPAGRYIYAVGGNPEAARLSGVKVDRITWASLVAASTIAGFAGVCYASLTGPSLTYGPSLLLPAFAAVFLGSTQVWPGRFNLWGTMIAVFVLATGIVGLQFVTGLQWLDAMFSGVALIVAVAFAGWRQRRRTAE